MICKKCYNFTKDEVVDLWYNHYCLAARKTDEEIRQEEISNEEHFKKWSKATNNGAKCQVSFCGTIGYNISRTSIEYNYCREVYKDENNCTKFDEMSIKDRIKRFFYIS